VSALTQRVWLQWNGLFDRPGSLRAAALVRILVGPIVLVHLLPFLRAMVQGRYYADAFYSPWVSWWPEPGRGLYFTLLGACAVSAITLSLGQFSRLSAGYSLAFVAYNLFLSQTHFHHNRAYLVINLAFLALIPCGRLLSVDAWLSRRRGRAPAELASLWPMYLLRFEAVSVYAASGSSKLLNADWWSGLVTFDRVHRFMHRLEASIAPRWFIDLLSAREFHYVFAKVAVFTELGIALGLLWPRTRLAAVWLAIAFHVAIGIGLQVEVFSYLAIAALTIWATPRTRERQLRVDRGRAGGRLLWFCARRLDWLARFRLQPEPPPHGVILLTDRDGRQLRGAAAALLALSRCPPLFPLLGPFLLPGLRTLWERAFGRAFSEVEGGAQQQ